MRRIAKLEPEIKVPTASTEKREKIQPLSHSLRNRHGYVSNTLLDLGSQPRCLFVGSNNLIRKQKILCVERLHVGIENLQRDAVQTRADRPLKVLKRRIQTPDHELHTLPLGCPLALKLHGCAIDRLGLFGRDKTRRRQHNRVAQAGVHEMHCLKQ